MTLAPRGSVARRWQLFILAGTAWNVAALLFDLCFAATWLVLFQGAFTLLSFPVLWLWLYRPPRGTCDVEPRR